MKIVLSSVKIEFFKPYNFHKGLYKKSFLDPRTLKFNTLPFHVLNFKMLQSRTPKTRCGALNSKNKRFKILTARDVSMEVQIDTVAMAGNPMRNSFQKGRRVTRLTPTVSTSYLGYKSPRFIYLFSFTWYHKSSNTQSTPSKSRTTLSHFVVTPDVDGDWTQSSASPTSRHASLP